MVQGLIFDIQRCSLHDGPGIRTTVFLKGCVLHCLWCHNPESIAFEPQILYMADRCVTCGECARVCSHGAQVIDPTGQHVYDRGRCRACGECVPTCQGEAIRLVGTRMTVDEVLADVLRDAAYYARSQGGVTLSGGEPMAQFEFTRSFLQAAHAAGLHTCLETCGAVNFDRYAEILPLVDLFLYDYKATDPDQHRRLTGVSNTRILDNLHRLDAAGAAIVLRCPLVPGVNDDDQHLQGIAALARQYPRLRGIDLMAYHNLGIVKADQIGTTSSLTAVQPPSDEIQAGWLARLHALGCTAARLS
jgi:pyruvate formate lyase activating enzyme